jgi:hypothetical protein
MRIGVFNSSLGSLFVLSHRGWEHSQRSHVQQRKRSNRPVPASGAPYNTCGQVISVGVLTFHRAVSSRVFFTSFVPPPQHLSNSGGNRMGWEATAGEDKSSHHRAGPANPSHKCEEGAFIRAAGRAVPSTRSRTQVWQSRSTIPEIATSLLRRSCSISLIFAQSHDYLPAKLSSNIAAGSHCRKHGLAI